MKDDGRFEAMEIKTAIFLTNLANFFASFLSILVVDSFG
jgi:hypothetical protein